MRIVELDFIRGIALITILLNHFSWFAKELGYSGNTIPTLTYFGYSSAAEMFFLLSGYLVGYVYLSAQSKLGAAQVSARLVGRALFLMAANCLMFVAILALCFRLPAEVISGLRLTPMIETPAMAAFEMIRIGHSILLGDILGAYILMMLLAAILVPLLLHRTAAALTVIAGLWLVAQLFPGFTLSGGKYGGDGRISYNPLAWQALFLGGMVAGKHQFHLWLKDFFSTRRHFIALMAAAAFLTFCFLLDGKLGLVGSSLNAKTTLGPVRLLHALVIMITLLALVYRFGSLTSTLPFAAVALIGRHSLQCFVAGVLLNYAMAAMLYPTNSLPMYLAIAARGVLALLLIAAGFEIHALAKKGRLPGLSRSRA